MAIFREEFNSLGDLLLFELKDLNDAEHRILESMPSLIEAAHDPTLKSALKEHEEETRRQVTRLEEAFTLLDAKAERETCDAMKGLVKECEEVISSKADPAIRDAAIVAAAQRIEHYEMAGYGSARNFAGRINRPDVANLLQETLNEEGAADEKLTKVATEHLNPAAASH